MARRFATIVAAALAGVLALALAPAPAAATATAPAAEVVEVPVRFAVRNVNRTELPCPSNRRRHEVVGHLTAPAEALRRPGPRAVSVHLHGVALGEPTWRFRGLPGYDHAHEMARAGHVVLTLDQLGYGASDIPYGALVCPGGQATVVEQIVEQLRAGAYSGAAQAGGGFDRVALVGLSFGGMIAEVVAATFGSVDAIAVVGWSNSSMSDRFFFEGFGRSWCERKRPGAPNGYTWNFVDPDESAMLASAGREMIEAFKAARERDPCGLYHGIFDVAIAPQRLARVDVPVLLAYGERDVLFEPSAGAEERDRFSGSDDVTLAYVERAGHFVPLEPQAPALRELLSGWLRERGL